MFRKWQENNGSECTSADLKSLTTRQKMAFLDILLNNAMPMKHETLLHMNDLYNISGKFSDNFGSVFGKFQLSRPLAYD